MAGLPFYHDLATITAVAVVSVVAMFVVMVVFVIVFVAGIAVSVVVRRRIVARLRTVIVVRYNRTVCVEQAGIGTVITVHSRVVRSEKISVIQVAVVVAGIRIVIPVAGSVIVT
tara:strand:+ start:37539 stop:37880 length:342 start_codon:yes stop_codon:yes gene_type:complete